MALPSSGPISLLDIQNEFGGSNPISISEYYGVDTGVPTSGTISLSNFYGTASFTPAINTNGLYIYYDMRYSYPGSGSVLSDMSGNGNNGTITGSPTFSGGNSFVFDGITGKSILTSNTGSTFWNSNWTASFWVKFDVISTSVSSGNGYVLFQQGTFVVNGYRSFEQRANSTWISTFNGIGETSVNENVFTLTANTLYYCTVSVDSSNNVKFYINGQPGTTGVLNVTVSNTEATLLDNSTLGIGNPFDGTFYAFHLYNRVLSAAEVLANYNAESGVW